MPSLTVLRYEPRRDLDGATVGVVTIRLAALIVVELTVKRLLAGGFRIVWPPSTHAAETEVARGIEATTFRLLAERGDLDPPPDRDASSDPYTQRKRRQRCGAVDGDEDD